MVATPVAISLVWLMMYDPATGVLGFALRSVGLPAIAWTSDPRWVIPSLVLVDVWQWTPLVALICMAGLAGLPSGPYEAATIDGASRWQTFWHITMPLLRPTIVVALLFRTIDTLKNFDTIWVISGGGPAFASETLNIYVYKMAFEYLNVGYASALLVIFFAIVLGTSLFLIKLRRGAW
jgi:multiple sugar transport system permease protein